MSLRMPMETLIFGLTNLKTLKDLLRELSNENETIIMSKVHNNAMLDLLTNEGIS